VDPEQTAVRSERKVTQESQGAGLAAGGVAGAQANQPLAAAPASAGGRTGGRSTMEDQVRNFDVSKTTTTTVSRVPRLQRISVAVLVDGLNGAPRPAEELTRLGDLAKRAVGFDEARGDVFEISSAPFAHAEAGPAEVAAPAPAPFLGLPPAAVWGGGGLAALAVLGVLGFALTRRRAPSHGGELPITPGARVAEIEAALMREAAALGAGSAPPALGRPALADPAATLRDRARELATKDPTRAAHILRAWMAQEGATQRQHGA
jgi:flagellar M-ring protein FliF